MTAEAWVWVLFVTKGVMTTKATMVMARSNMAPKTSLTASLRNSLSSYDDCIELNLLCGWRRGEKWFGKNDVIIADFFPQLIAIIR